MNAGSRLGLNKDVSLDQGSIQGANQVTSRDDHERTPDQADGISPYFFPSFIFTTISEQLSLAEVQGLIEISDDDLGTPSATFPPPNDLEKEVYVAL